MYGLIVLLDHDVFWNIRRAVPNGPVAAEKVPIRFCIIIFLRAGISLKWSYMKLWLCSFLFSQRIRKCFSIMSHTRKLQHLSLQLFANVKAFCLSLSYYRLCDMERFGDLNELTESYCWFTKSNTQNQSRCVGLCKHMQHHLNIKWFAGFCPSALVEVAVDRLRPILYNRIRSYLMFRTFSCISN